jgi:putative membrane protein
LEQILSVMPAINAVLISTSGLFIIGGVVAIKRGQRERHQKAMLIATSLATLFFILYVTRLALGGMTPFQGPPAVKMIYLFILASHVLLATVQAPMTLVTLWRAMRGNWSDHRRIARFTYPIWIYVSFTGVLVFGLLHYRYA